VNFKALNYFTKKKSYCNFLKWFNLCWEILFVEYLVIAWYFFLGNIIWSKILPSIALFMSGRCNLFYVGIVSPWWDMIWACFLPSFLDFFFFFRWFGVCGSRSNLETAQEFYIFEFIVFFYFRWRFSTSCISFFGTFFGVIFFLSILYI
jgi:hypothetical protein